MSKHKEQPKRIPLIKAFELNVMTDDMKDQYSTKKAVSLLVRVDGILYSIKADAQSTGKFIINKIGPSGIDL